MAMEVNVLSGLMARITPLPGVEFFFLFFFSCVSSVASSSVHAESYFIEGWVVLGALACQWRTKGQGQGSSLTGVRLQPTGTGAGTCGNMEAIYRLG